jgi:hypothetical protein
VAILTTDNREHDKDYLNPNPGFDSAPAAVLRKEYTFDVGGDN